MNNTPRSWRLAAVDWSGFPIGGPSGGARRSCAASVVPRIPAPPSVGGPVHGRLAGPLAGYPGLSQPMAAAMQDSYSPMAACMGSGPCLRQQHRDAASYSYILHDSLGLGAYSRASANPAGQGGIAGGHPAAYAVSGASPHGAAGVTVPVQVPGQTTDLSVPSNYWPRLQ
ncbi:hypothetical protein MRX96_039573 [Rhipicephalus microplus]